MAHRDIDSEKAGVSVALLDSDCPKEALPPNARTADSAIHREIKYRRALQEDAALLVQLRKTVLIAANKLEKDTDLSHIDENSAAYFGDMNKHTTYLARDGEDVVGVGSVDYHTQMPTVANPTGKCAFLMNVYTAPDYRRKGIASEIVRLLIADAKEKGAGSVMLEATEMGAAMYRKLGFAEAEGYMLLGD